MAWNDDRPMSPHLQVYKLPLTAKLSIFHRGTGAVLFLGLIMMVWVFAVAASGEQSWQGMHDFLNSIIGKIFLMGFSFSLFYHLANGIRHLIWDTGRGMSLKEANTSGKILIGAVAIATLISWIMIIF